MYSEVFINDFVTLGNILNPSRSINKEYPIDTNIFQNSERENSFFSKSMQLKALDAVCSKYLVASELLAWLSDYNEMICERTETVGIIMAGNIPIVGFHDLLGVLACGFKAQVKLSSKDKYLPAAIIETLFSINSYWRTRISIVPKISEHSSIVIAAGSDDTILAIKETFAKARLLLRGNRSSVAVLTGNESDGDFKALSSDIFTYYGLGCRSVSTLIVPADFNLDRFNSTFSDYKNMMVSNSSYNASYRQRKAILNIENVPFFDGDFFLIAHFDKIPPPLACINLIYYKDSLQINDFFSSNKDKVQAVCSMAKAVNREKFGEMQYPKLGDYADGINTLEFLLNNFS